VKNSHRVALAPAYVLHQYAYRDTSRIVEAFTHDYGRVSLFARGARTPKSPLRAGLRPFQRLLLSWSGKSDAGQLTAAEIDGAASSMPSARLMSGFYSNELLLKLTERWDPHPDAFTAYAYLLDQLMGIDGEQAALRRFEKRLLETLGYGVDFSNTDCGEPIDPQCRYQVRPGGAVCRCEDGSVNAIRGRSIIDLAREHFGDAETLHDAKLILRNSIEALLDGRALGSREVMRALHVRSHHELPNAD
jgi:DNA repair protein RecO (recombination protein O)